MARRSYTSRAEEASGPKVEFELDGVVFVAEAGFSPLDIAELAKLGTAGVDSESIEGLAVLGEVFEGLLGTATYQKFRRHCRVHRTSGETLMAVFRDVVEEMSARPTDRPSDSPDGPQTAPATAKVVSFSRATVEETPVPEKQEERRVVSYG